MIADRDPVRSARCYITAPPDRHYSHTDRRITDSPWITWEYQTYTRSVQFNELSRNRLFLIGGCPMSKPVAAEQSKELPIFVESGMTIAMFLLLLILI
jgi:hypothetical protein